MPKIGLYKRRPTSKKGLAKPLMGKYGVVLPKEPWDKLLIKKKGGGTVALDKTRWSYGHEFEKVVISPEASGVKTRVVKLENLETGLNKAFSDINRHARQVKKEQKVEKNAYKNVSRIANKAGLNVKEGVAGFDIGTGTVKVRIGGRIRNDIVEPEAEFVKPDTSWNDLTPKRTKTFLRDLGKLKKRVA